MDGRPNRRNKAPFSNFFGVGWTLPKTSLNNHLYDMILVNIFTLARCNCSGIVLADRLLLDVLFSFVFCRRIHRVGLLLCQECTN